MNFARFLAASLLLASVGPAAASGWSLRVQHWQSEPFELAGADGRDTERHSLRADWHAKHAHGRTGVVYEYQPLLIRTGTPATNGHLHRLDLTHTTRLGETRMDAALGLHGSSNIFDDGRFLLGGGELRSEVLVGRFRVMRPIPGPIDAVGLAGDYRFGEFLLYPRIAATTTLGKGELFLELPVSIGWRDAGGRWRVGLERYGERWATLDATETVEGKLYLDEWRLAGRYRLGRWRGARLDIGAGLSFDTEARYRDLERGRVKGELETALFGFVKISR